MGSDCSAVILWGPQVPATQGSMLPRSYRSAVVVLSDNSLRVVCRFSSGSMNDCAHTLIDPTKQTPHGLGPLPLALR
jgi:hypothetical protein